MTFGYANPRAAGMPSDRQATLPGDEASGVYIQGLPVAAYIQGLAAGPYIQGLAAGPYIQGLAIWQELIESARAHRARLSAR